MQTKIILIYCAEEFILNKKSTLSIFLLAGITLLTCSTVVTIMHNSNYISYNYLPFSTAQNTKNTDDQFDSGSDVVTKKQKRGRADLLFGYSSVEDSDKHMADNTVTPKHTTVSLEESISVNTNDDSNNLQNYLTKIRTTNKIVLLTDTLTLQTVNMDQAIFLPTQIKPEKITTLDRILNPERIRYNGKAIVFESPQVSFNDVMKLPQQFADQILQNLDKEPQLNLAQFDVMVSPIFVAAENDLHQFNNNLLIFVHDVSSPDSNVLLVLLVPLSGYILIRSENEKLKIKNQTKFLSSFFIVILLSSTAVTPFSISGNYWWMAFADNGTNSTSQETLNYTGITVQNQTLPISKPGSNQTVSSYISIQDSLSTILKPGSNSTNSVSTNTETNSTNPANATYTSNIGFSDTINATVQFPPGSIVSSLGLSDSVSAILNGTITTNGTGITGITNHTENQTIPILPLPNATKSFNFTTTNGTVGEADTKNGTLLLQGQGYLSQRVNATDNLKSLTISAWVQPDYTQGSAIFTVISKENQFALTINNNIPPKQTAQFSVYDGIHWNTVNSTVTIPQDDWTHLAATYNGTHIALYVNGTFQSSLKLPGVLTLASDGHLTPVTADNISSDSDVVIGAQIEAIRNDVRYQFSGQIKDVNLYDALLDQSQILHLYQKDAGTDQAQTVLPVVAEQNRSQVNVTTSDGMPISDSIQIVTDSTINSTGTAGNSTVLIDSLPILDSIQTVFNSTSVNGTGINTTSLDIVPTIQSTKQSYSLGDSPEFTFKIFKDSDLKKIKKQIKQTVQQNGWTEKNSTISVKILAPDGTEIPVSTKFTKQKEGQFDIQVSSKRFGKPGIYTIQTTLVKNGKTYTTQNQYAWGLVSLNTDKSIYRPGQNANMTIVVLDSQGSPVCDAIVSMGVISPNGTLTSLSTGN